MTLRWQLKALVNQYTRPVTFLYEEPKWKVLLDIGELCLSDSLLDEDLDRRLKLRETLVRLSKNIVNPKSEDVAFILRMADDILTRKHEEIPEGTFAIGEDVL